MLADKLAKHPGLHAVAVVLSVATAFWLTGSIVCSSCMHG